MIRIKPFDRSAENIAEHARAVIDAEGIDLPSDAEYTVLPGFCDVHVHFREPGFSHKGRIYNGSRAAAHGGYTAVCTMPNLSPVPDSLEHLRCELDIIRRDSVINIYPYASITVGEGGEVLSDMQELAPYAVAFSDDGRGVQSDDVMEAAMRRAASLGKLIVAHCEVNELLHGGYIHDGEYARAHGHRGISSESEWRQIERDLALAKKTGCAYHVCHISTAESVELIRSAKRDGVDVTCETAPHYLTLTDRDLREDGRFKMNPPLRSEADRAALIEGVTDGTIDMIATDHAPHSAEEKSHGLEGSPFGIVGLETALSVLYTRLVREGVLPMERLMELLAAAPRRRFEIPDDGGFSIWRLDEETTVDPNEFLSLGRATPYAGERLLGVNHLTYTGGRCVYKCEK